MEGLMESKVEKRVITIVLTGTPAKLIDITFDAPLSGSELRGIQNKLLKDHRKFVNAIVAETRSKDENAKTTYTVVDN